MPLHAKPATVSFRSNPLDQRVALLGSLGFSTQYICAETGLTPCQVTYRLHKASIKRSSYRNGESPIVEAVLSTKENPLYRTIEKEVMRELKLRDLY